MDDPSGDAELLAPELVANAAEHTGSQQIGLILRQAPGGTGSATPPRMLILGSP
jgi:hypothetical protein